MAKTFSRADKAIEEYTIETFHPEDKVLLEIRQRAEKEGLPDIHVGPMDGLHLEVIARARFIEDLVVEKSGHGVRQYVILGAGLDTFAQRRPEIGAKLRIFEVDPPGPQAWKRQRLIELGYGTPAWLRFVPVDFEAGTSWLEKLKTAGFDAGKPSVVSSTGVSMYLTPEAVLAMLRQVAQLAPGSTLAMTYILPLELVNPEERVGFEMAIKGAKASETPFLSFFTPAQIMTLAREAGFKEVRCVSGADLTQRYFAGQTDGLHPGSEELLVATT